MKVAGFYSLVLLFALAPLCNVQAQKESGKVGQHWNINVQGGTLFKDQSALSKLLFKDDGNGFDANVYTQLGLGVTLNWNSVLVELSGKRGYFNQKVAMGDGVEIVDQLAEFALGYDVLKSSRLSLAPLVGVVSATSAIAYSYHSAVAPSSVQALVASPNGQGFHIKTQNYYASAGIDFSYQTGKGQYFKHVPLELGLKAAYWHRISNSKWKSGLDKSIEGPNVFDSSLYLGFSIGWWVI